MKYLVLLLVCVANFAYSQTAKEKEVSEYLNSIRNNRALLTVFFQQMPKGGDLHNHYSGSIYAESFFDCALKNDYWIDTNTLELFENQPTTSRNTFLLEFPENQPVTISNTFKKLSTLKNEGTLEQIRYRLFKQWSVKDYDQEVASDKQFFDTFGYFGKINLDYNQGLLELKKRAKSENVQYLETMLKSVKCGFNIQDFRGYNIRTKNTDSLKTIFDEVYQKLLSKGIVECAIKHNQLIEELHKKNAIDDSSFTMRYQNYIRRTVENPMEVFTSLVASFISAEKSKLIVGVNIVAPEDNSVSMNDYWLHIQMFRWCKQKFPTVKFSLHAGELTLGLVQPEELTWHINSAVRDAGAYRIGHGVDIAYEKNAFDLLNFMRTNKVAIEINLSSNEFILKVKDDKHPINLYRQADVPIVICTDDAGVLRTNLTEQYVLLANRYNINYVEFKKYVYNSINYSFIEEDTLKQKINTYLDKEFLNFENTILSYKSKK